MGMLHGMPTSIKEYLGELSQENPDKIISKIRVELESLFNEIVKRDTRELYLAGRKSRHLFHPLLSSRLMEKTSIHFLNILTGKVRGERVCVIDHWKKLPKEISLLADSINDGEEKASIISIMKKNGTKIRNIFCYAANEEGIAFLDSKGILPRENVFSLHVLSPEDYVLFNKRLETYYQSRIEPMDTDHEFYVFSIAKAISEKNLYSLFEASVKRALDCSAGEFSKAVRVDASGEDANILFTPENIANFNFECYDYNICKKEVCSTLRKTKIEYLQIRLKAELKGTETTISLMVFCPPDNVPLDAIFKNGKCRFRTPLCSLETVKYDVSEFKKDEIAEMVCPQCIESQISLPILEKVATKLETRLGVSRS